MNDASVAVGKEQQHTNYVVTSRKIIAAGSDVYVKEFVLAPGEEVPWHYHTDIFDVFYCIEGQLNVDTADIFSREQLSTASLDVGDSFKVEAGVAHRPFNPGSGRCRFVIIQGIGAYDYLPFAL